VLSSTPWLADEELDFQFNPGGEKPKRGSFEVCVRSNIASNELMNE